MPKVSICIPTYNGERYLTETLSCILNQTYNDFEILIIDDLSSDNTWKILNHYAAKDNRIRLFKNEKNLGLVGNWNRCIELAQGEWVKFVFQDDIISNDCLELMIKEAHPENPLIFCRRDFFFDSKIDDQLKKIYLAIPRLDEIYPDTDFINPDQVCRIVLTDIRNVFGEPTSSLIHKSVFERYGLFNSSMVQICDLEYWTRVGVNTGIRYIAKSLVKFRVHTSSISSKNFQDSQLYRSDYLDSLILLHEYAYNIFYEPLRVFQKKSYPHRNFKKELADKAFWLKNLAETSSKVDSNLITAKDHWVMVGNRYPRIKFSFYLIPYKIKHWLNTMLLWRFVKH